ncbi:MAG: magnesium and cobalt transport protein CorA [Sphingobacteriales bacterium 17-39-43]|uniref:magnesium/cobalt transporter CorA n=1 Tax=Daejeonella sp. TaxID=2805397 RepID=UPI000BDAF0C8|nr:magnesium/cobalt transporter CorA [Daejeonella sp.]MCF8453862.1 magnesium/cobalt transporter CorA [Pedobacter sp.]OYZ32901.1 MAG: magnesium and cobalt transport protein CorA [Sphingobacteriales bacterium 16-39-50]OZA26311.1 MAG: magnesium and cobalt transport protein CorA [Sphingobacteriales bacterium 17-39-43]HQT23518.1 magnesium/cobalt transporter CorA [Daejeonella sp.]HQT56167.1 magnesium/cobalt transporter CorA [Daejeonella sp.]
MARIRRISLKSKKYVPMSGTSPGSIQLYEGALKPRITIYSFKGSEFHSLAINSYEEIDVELDSYSGFNHWIDIRGIGDVKLLEYLQNKFSINKLVMEDITDCRQRPKLDEYSDFLFTVSRNMYVNENLEIENEQVSFILLPHILISFQESYGLTFEPVIHRLEGGKGNIRTGETSYLLYALLDVIVDNYFTLIYKLGDELETIEQLLYRKADKALMFQTQNIKREMIMIRRAAWPERDKINDMIRSESGLITKTSKTFLKDTYDHCMQIIDLVESYKDLTTSLVDMNLSLISHRMNEVMKVLTIISSIFIPLTFIAGIYGMNFAKQDPETGKWLHNNMPELYMDNGYAYTMIGMLLIAIIQMIYFWRKGWLNKS